MNMRIIRYVSLVIILVGFFGLFSTKIWDVDFWQHISFGRYVVETFTIPDKDPFLMYEATGVRNDTILQANWLGQIVLYVTYALLGVAGIIVLKASILTACLYTIYKRGLFLEAGPVALLTTIVLVGITLINFTGERPQLFSFLFAAIVFLLLDRVQAKTKTWQLVSIPILTFIWANCHGAFVLGAVILGVMAIGYFVESKFLGVSQEQRMVPLFLIIAIMLTLFLPYGLKTYLYVLQFEGSEIKSRTSEYLSPVSLWQDLGIKLPAYWAFLVLLAVSLRKFLEKKRSKEFAVILLLAGLSLSAYRYIPFLLLFASPYVALGLTRLTNRMRFPEMPVQIATVISATILLVYGVREGKVFQFGLQEQRFPEAAVQFIKRQGIQGKLFNHLDWGGYLLWNLYPTSTVFIDGRLLDPKILHPYTNILWATPQGLEMLDRYGFDFVLIPYSNRFSGEIYSLNNYLLDDPRWQPVYSDQVGYLFARKSANSAVVR